MDPKRETQTDPATEEIVKAEGEQPQVGILDFLAFIPFFVAFLGTLCFFELRFRLAKSFKSKEAVAASLNRLVRACLSLVGTKITIENPEQAPLERPWLIVSNHQSLFDVSVLHTIFAAKRPKFIAKKELGKGIPGVSICLREEGAALIDRSDARQALKEIASLGKRMHQDNFGVIIFPEGTRARRGAMKAFKSRGIAALLKHCPNAIIIPVALDGSWKLATRKVGPIPLGTSMKCKVGSFIEPQGREVEELVAETEERVKALLCELRK